MGQYGNVSKMVDLSMPSWVRAADAGIAKIRVKEMTGNRLISNKDHQFINMCSCSYLGLNEHPDIIAGARNALSQRGYMALSLSRARIGDILVDETEELLSEAFDCTAKLTTCCTAASIGILPLIASGVFTHKNKP